MPNRTEEDRARHHAAEAVALVDTVVARLPDGRRRRAVAELAAEEAAPGSGFWPTLAERLVRYEGSLPELPAELTG